MPAAHAADLDDRVAAVRAFNRFYTRRIGALGPHHLDSAYSLTELRVLYELAYRGAATPTAIGRDLGLDAGYLSRIVGRFAARGLIGRTPSPADRRQTVLRLTPRGRATFRPLERRTRREVASLLAALHTPEQRQVVDAMRTIERLLGPRTAPRELYVLRPPRPGDMGWVVQRHGALYAQEWGYDERFEALVARIVGEFVESHDPARERCWIAEVDGENAGSVFLVAKSKTVAKLRLLIVEPHARGLGIGRRLVDECVRFARAAGYRSMTLWTHSQLEAARRLYRGAGFRCVDKVSRRSFGQDLVDETWELSF
jgi:DNA-binding MarR family transcriptional regulator/N-acetylglutamate synthase-like GNAT family acetyltransferase